MCVDREDPGKSLSLLEVFRHILQEGMLQIVSQLNPRRELREMVNIRRTYLLVAAYLRQPGLFVRLALGRGLLVGEGGWRFETVRLQE